MTDAATKSAAPPKKRHHPASVEIARRRADNKQLKLADAITKFAGSMTFVYVHIVVFAVWMIFVEGSPWPTLTLVVSLEAIFLSTFVMIGQNRQSDYTEAKADHDFATGEQQLDTNTQLTKSIHDMTKLIYDRLDAGNTTTGPPDK